MILVSDISELQSMIFFQTKQTKPPENYNFFYFEIMKENEDQ